MAQLLLFMATALFNVEFALIFTASSYTCPLQKIIKELARNGKLHRYTFMIEGKNQSRLCRFQNHVFDSRLKQSIRRHATEKNRLLPNWPIIKLLIHHTFNCQGSEIQITLVNCRYHFLDFYVSTTNS